MKKIFVTIGLVLVIVGYALRNPAQKLSSASPSGATNTGATPPPPPPSVATASYKDGTYTGPSTFSIYGNVQAQAVVAGGRITTINVLKFPNDRENSIRISNLSLPILKSEAIQKQSGAVDIVSGATQTSEAFVTSLTAALQQAT